MSGVTGKLQGIKVELGVGGIVIFLESGIKLTSFDGHSVCYAEILLTLAEERSLFEVLTNMVDTGDLDGSPVPFIPTPENVNALPEGIRDYIHELETRCDPTSEFRAWKAGEDAVLALAIQNKALKAEIAGLKAELLISEAEELALKAEIAGLKAELLISEAEELALEAELLDLERPN